MASIKRLVGVFNHPLDLFVSHQYGNIYALEHGDAGAGGALVTLRPAGEGSRPPARPSGRAG